MVFILKNNEENSIFFVQSNQSLFSTSRRNSYICFLSCCLNLSYLPPPFPLSLSLNYFDASFWSLSKKKLNYCQVSSTHLSLLKRSLSNLYLLGSRKLPSNLITLANMPPQVMDNPEKLVCRHRLKSSTRLRANLSQNRIIVFVHHKNL